LRPARGEYDERAELGERDVGVQPGERAGRHGDHDAAGRQQRVDKLSRGGPAGSWHSAIIAASRGWFRGASSGNPVTVRISIDEDAGQYRWRLVRRTPQGADVVARSVRAYPDEHACRSAAAALGRASAEAMLSVQEADGHWRWVVMGPDGEPLAESPAVLRDAA